MSGPDHSTLLRRLSGISPQSWDNPCKIPILNYTTERPTSAAAKDHLATTPNQLLEDSGYESPSSKTEETQEQETFEQRHNFFLPRPACRPMSKVQPSRIPVSASTVKFPVSRSSDTSTGADEPFTRLHPSSQGMIYSSKTMIGDQNDNNIQIRTNEEPLTEEMFLRTQCQQKEPSQCQRPKSAFVSSLPQSRRCHSKSVPPVLNRAPIQHAEKSGSLNRMTPPRFNIRPPSPNLCSSGQFTVNAAVKMPSLLTMLKSSDSFKAIQTLVDQSVYDILNDGEKEFSGKYSGWIQQVFNLQLEKIHSRLKAAYTEKLAESLEAKKAEVLEIKSAYRSKLLEFESATKKFQEWYDDVLEENRNQAEANQELWSQFMDKEASLQKEYSAQLQSQLIQLEADAEKERKCDLELHAEQLKQISTKCEAENQLLAGQYQHQIDSLKTQLEAMQNTNTALQQKYTELRDREAENACCAACNGDDEVVTDNGALGDLERQELKGHIQMLELRIQEMETKSKEAAAAHSEEVDKLHLTLDKNNQKLRQLIKETRLSAAATRADHERGIREMQDTILGKEAEYKKRLTTLTERYGKKIEELTNSVHGLRTQLLTKCD